MAIIAFRKQQSFWLIGLFTIINFGKDSNDEVATEQLTAIVDAKVDVTFMPHDGPEIS